MLATLPAFSPICTGEAKRKRASHPLKRASFVNSLTGADPSTPLCGVVVSLLDALGKTACALCLITTAKTSALYSDGRNMQRQLLTAPTYWTLCNKAAVSTFISNSNRHTAQSAATAVAAAIFCKRTQNVCWLRLFFQAAHYETCSSCSFPKVAYA